MDALRERMLAVGGVAVARCYTTVLLVKERLNMFSPLGPYIARAFHVCFIPFVVILGMRTAGPEGRPKLIDLLTPM